MKRERIDTEAEQKITIAMVVSKEFLSQVCSSIDLDLFQAKHLRQIASWCKKYWEKYRDAPKENIERIYSAWSEKGKAQDEVVDAVADVLEWLSDQYEEQGDINVPYLMDTATDYFSTRRLLQLRDTIEYELTEGDRAHAEAAVNTFNTVSVGQGEDVDPLNDDEAWDTAFAEAQEPLIKWNNRAADFFFGQALCRDSLIAVLAPEKRGKTWWCVEFAMRAVSQRKKVALFEVGDMSQSQIMRRLGVRLSRRPMFKKHLGNIPIPKAMFREDNEIEIETKTIEAEHVASAQSSKKAISRFLRKSGIKQGSSYIKISTHANSSVNVADISGILEKWANHEGFVPDVILIDYPDILAPEPGGSGLAARDQINTTWKALRRLSQEKHCLVIAPTQADAASYAAETLSASNFSEDKRKIAHVTGMLGLNQNANEKGRGIMRLNWIVLRESEFAPESCLHVGQCLTLGRAFCCATL